MFGINGSNRSPISQVDRSAPSAPAQTQQVDPSQTCGATKRCGYSPDDTFQPAPNQDIPQVQQQQQTSSDDSGGGFFKKLMAVVLPLIQQMLPVLGKLMTGGAA